MYPTTDPASGRFADPGTLYFLFDFISHNAYLAWARAQQLASDHGLSFEPVPVVFGAMLSAHGQIGPAEVPPKSRWMLRDVLRKAAQLNLPIAPPHSHPFKSLSVLRLACCSLSASQRLRLIDTLWRATWAQSRDVTDAEVLRTTLATAGFDAESLLAESGSEAVKLQLRANTDAALAAGVFGVPSVWVRGQLFWGYDDLGFLQAFLENRDPLSASTDFDAWMQVRPSVQRRR
ncbi:MAG: 2-hydroxychromene-2-carboxylate isomerase [Panacagrimonas sp.]